MEGRRQPTPGPEPDSTGQGLARYARLLANVEDCLWQTLVDADGNPRVLYVSPAWMRIWGFEPEDLYRNPNLWIECILDEDRSLAQTVFEATFREGTAQTVSYRIRNRQGDIRWIEDHMSPDVDLPDGSKSICGVARDITYRKQLEARAMQLERHSLLSQLADGIAHDFNNLLVGILGRASLLRHDCDDPQVRHELSEIERTARFAEELCKHLRAYAGRIELERRAEDLNAVLRESVGLLRLVAGASLRIELELEAASSWTRIDRVQLRQILLNLVRNAAEAGARHVRLRSANFRLREDDLARLDAAPNVEPGDYLMLRIEDDGVGFDIETGRRVFEPFYSTKGLGRGLGLATVRGIVLAHEGALQVASQPGRGSSFSMYLPVVEAPEPAEIPPPEATGPRLRGASVLLVDDDESILQVTQRMLQRLGFSIQLARDARGALALAEDAGDRFQIAIVDSSLGHDDGIELAVALRRRRPDLPVLLMSGLDRRDDLEAALGRSPTIGLLLKPFTPEQLLARISEVVLR
jgi:PAS domain S-box-containing protein